MSDPEVCCRVVSLQLIIDSGLILETADSGSGVFLDDALRSPREVALVRIARKIGSSSIYKALQGAVDKMRR